MHDERNLLGSNGVDRIGPVQHRFSVVGAALEMAGEMTAAAIALGIASIFLTGALWYYELGRWAELLIRLVRLEQRTGTVESHFVDPETHERDLEEFADMYERRLAGRETDPRPGTEPHARVTGGPVLDAHPAGRWRARMDGK